MADNRFKVIAVGTFVESAVDCPVQLKKYQIIYDVIADKTYLRAVLENFSNQKIVGVFLNVDCLDIFEKKFAEVAKVSVKVECDKKYSEFGKECPIIIPKGTKTVKAYISRVVFSDMTVWENRDLTFVAPVSDLKPYTAIKEKNQLEKELAKRNYTAKYLPVRYEKSWRCTCGHLNGNLNDVCSACRSRASILFNIFDDKNLEICKKEDTYNEARKFDASKDYLQASKLYSTILDYKDSKVLFVKALENSKEAIYTGALDTLKTAQKEEDFDSAIKSLSSISEYKDAKTQIEKAKEQKNEFIYNQALQRVKKYNVGKDDFDNSISDMQRIPSYKDSREKIKEIEAQKQVFLDKKEHARKMKKVRNISIVACVIAAIVIAILIPYFVEPNLYTGETTYKETTIGGQSGYCLARYNGNEEKVVIPSEYLGKPVLKIGERAFQGKSIKEITIPDSVTRIGESAFDDCTGLTSVTIGSGLTSIGYKAFYGCTALTSVTIPDSVTSIGDWTFYNCSGLTSVTIGNSVTSIGGGAFCNCTGLTSVTIPDSVTSIGWGAFRGCTGLTSIIIPDSVTSIDCYAFYVCTGLTSVNWNATACTSAGSSSYPIFEGCTNLAIVNIGENVTSIPSSAFYGRNGLTSVTIPDSVTNIGDGAFSGCTGLTSITIPDSVTRIGDDAFSGCTGLTSVTIGSGVTRIGDDAFSGCTGLTSVIIGNGVTSIGNYAFYNCTGLTSVTYKGTKAQWNAISKGFNWEYRVPSSCKVYCTDGTLSI